MYGHWKSCHSERSRRGRGRAASQVSTRANCAGLIPGCRRSFVGLECSCTWWQFGCTCNGSVSWTMHAGLLWMTVGAQGKVTWADRNVCPTFRQADPETRRVATEGGVHAAFRVSTREYHAGMIPCCSRSFVGLACSCTWQFGRMCNGSVSWTMHAGHFDRLSANPLDDNGRSRESDVGRQECLPHLHTGVLRGATLTGLAQGIIGVGSEG